MRYEINLNIVRDAERQAQTMPGARRLEHNNEANHRGDAGGHERLFRSFAGALRDGEPERIDGSRGDDEQNKINSARKRVKRIGKRQKIDCPPATVEQVERRRDGNEDDVEQR
jgi:hypothetical protein